MEVRLNNRQLVELDFSRHIEALIAAKSTDKTELEEQRRTQRALAQVQLLDASSNSIALVNPLGIFASLTTLDLSSNSLSFLDGANLPPTLRHLDISKNSFSHLDSILLGGAVSERFNAVPSPVARFRQHNGTTNTSVVDITIPVLETLTVRSNALLGIFSDDCLRAIANREIDPPQCANALRHLDLSDNMLPSIVGVEFLPAATTMILDSNRVHDLEAVVEPIQRRDIIAGPAAKGLQVLSLLDNPLLRGEEANTESTESTSRLVIKALAEAMPTLCVINGRGIRLTTRGGSSNNNRTETTTTTTQPQEPQYQHMQKDIETPDVSDVEVTELPAAPQEGSAEGRTDHQQQHREVPTFKRTAPQLNRQSGESSSSSGSSFCLAEDRPAEEAMSEEPEEQGEGEGDEPASSQSSELCVASSEEEEENVNGSVEENEDDAPILADAEETPASPTELDGRGGKGRRHIDNKKKYTHKKAVSTRHEQHCQTLADAVDLPSKLLGPLRQEAGGGDFGRQQEEAKVSRVVVLGGGPTPRARTNRGERSSMSDSDDNEAALHDLLRGARYDDDDDDDEEEEEEPQPLRRNQSSHQNRRGDYGVAPVLAIRDPRRREVELLRQRVAVLEDSLDAANATRRELSRQTGDQDALLAETRHTAASQHKLIVKLREEKERMLIKVNRRKMEAQKALTEVQHVLTAQEMVHIRMERSAQRKRRAHADDASWEQSRVAVASESARRGIEAKSHSLSSLERSVVSAALDPLAPSPFVHHRDPHSHHDHSKDYAVAPPPRHTVAHDEPALSQHRRRSTPPKKEERWKGEEESHGDARERSNFRLPNLV